MCVCGWVWVCVISFTDFLSISRSSIGCFLLCPVASYSPSGGDADGGELCGIHVNFDPEVDVPALVDPLQSDLATEKLATIRGFQFVVEGDFLDPVI